MHAAGGFWDPSRGAPGRAQRATEAGNVKWITCTRRLLNVHGAALICASVTQSALSVARMLSISESDKGRVILVVGRDGDARSLVPMFSLLDAATRNAKMMVGTHGDMLRRLSSDPTLCACEAETVIVEMRGEFEIVLAALLLVRKVRPTLRVVGVGHSATVTAMSVDVPVLYAGDASQIEIRYTRAAMADVQDAALRALTGAVMTGRLKTGMSALLFMPDATAAREVASNIDAWARRLAIKDRTPVRVRAALLLSGDTTGVVKGNTAYVTSVCECGLIAGRVSVSLVIDAGIAEMRIYDSGEWVVGQASISRTEADMRTQFAGNDGLCLRMYTSAFYEKMRSKSAPSILTGELSGSILSLKRLGVDDVANFAYAHAPPTCSALAAALERLHVLKVLSGTGTLRPMGRAMAMLPFELMMGRAVLGAGRFGVHDEVLAIACVLKEAPPGGSRALFHRAGARAKFAAEEGDLVTALNAFRAHEKGAQDWCARNGVVGAAMRRAQMLYRSLKLRVRKCEVDVAMTVGRDVGQRVCRALTEGMFVNAARRLESDEYLTVHGEKRSRVHPGSVLHNTQAEWLIYGECVVTGSRYLRDVSVIRAEWLADACEQLYEVQESL